MSCPRTSNQERAKWRVECRKKLADHICSQIGVIVLPADVKLITNPGDLYQWRILTAEKMALFKKQLSKHSTGAYIDLCNGVGQHFEAVLADGAASYEQTSTDVVPSALERNPDYFPSDSDNFKVAAEKWRERADAELARREALEVELTRAKTEIAGLSTEIETLRESEATQTRDLQKMTEIFVGLSDLLQSRALTAHEDSRQATRVAQYLQPGSNKSMPSHSNWKLYSILTWYEKFRDKWQSD